MQKKPKALLVIESIERVFMNDTTLNTSRINQVLTDLVAEYGYSDVTVKSNLDIEDGVYVKFSKGSEDVVVVFTLENSGYPEIVVVSADDANLTIDLRAIDPPLTEGGSVQFIDVSDTSWISKSIVGAILDAGKISEDEIYVVKGNQKIKLPIMIKSDTKSDFAQRCSEKVANMIWQ